MIARLKGHGAEATARIGGSGGGETGGGRAGPAAGQAGGVTEKYRGARGLDPELIRELERQYGFDRPASERFVRMIRSYLVLDFGQSFFRDRRVIDLIVEKLPVSISLGLWTTLLIYLVSIPLGVAKAVRDGSTFDVWTSTVVIVGYAIPGFLFAILLIVLFAGGSYLDWFPLRNLVSDHWRELSWPARVLDYFWHLTLPLVALLVGGFAGLTMLTKNSFLEEIRKQYVTTARSKGLTKRRVLYGHVFRNAMLIVVAGFPARVRGHPVHRRAPDRGDLLARRAGAARVRGRDQPGLPDHVRDALHLHARGPPAEPGQRPDLRRRRSAHRLRHAGDVTVAAPDTPMTRRRLATSGPTGAGFWSLWIFLALFVVSLLAEFIANDRPPGDPLRRGAVLPGRESITRRRRSAASFPTAADYRDPAVIELIRAKGWMVWPPIPFSYDTINYDLPVPAPAPPSAVNWLGTDDQGRDVLARLIYGFRISVLFGLTLTLLSSVIGIAAGAVQGYFGGLGRPRLPALHRDLVRDCRCSTC